MFKYFEDDVLDSVNVESGDVKWWCYNFNAYMSKFPLVEIMSKFFKFEEEFEGMFRSMYSEDNKQYKIFIDNLKKELYVNDELIDPNKKLVIGKKEIDLALLAKNEFGLRKSDFVEAIEFKDGRTYNKVNGIFKRYIVVGE